jgi:hypothetical protein
MRQHPKGYRNKRRNLELCGMPLRAEGFFLVGNSGEGTRSPARPTFSEQTPTYEVIGNSSRGVCGGGRPAG